MMCSFKSMIDSLSTTYVGMINGKAPGTKALSSNPCQNSEEAPSINYEMKLNSCVLHSNPP